MEIGYEKENRIKENKGREVNGEIIVGNGLVINEDGRTVSRESKMGEILDMDTTTKM